MPAPGSAGHERLVAGWLPASCVPAFSALGSCAPWPELPGRASSRDPSLANSWLSHLASQLERLTPSCCSFSLKSLVFTCSSPPDEPLNVASLGIPRAPCSTFHNPRPPCLSLSWAAALVPQPNTQGPMCSGLHLSQAHSPRPASLGPPHHCAAWGGGSPLPPGGLP